MTENRTVKVETYIAAAPVHVYRAFATSPGLQEWMADAAAADARPGGRFYSWWNQGFYAGGALRKRSWKRKWFFPGMRLLIPPRRLFP